MDTGASTIELDSRSLAAGAELEELDSPRDSCPASKLLVVGADSLLDADEGEPALSSGDVDSAVSVVGAEFDLGGCGFELELVEAPLDFAVPNIGAGRRWVNTNSG